MNYPGKIINAYPFAIPARWGTVPFYLFFGLFAILLATPFSTAFSQEYFYQEKRDNNFYLGDKFYHLSYSNVYRDFKIPEAAAGKYLFIEARGGDGGSIGFRGNIHPGKGGQGASVIAAFPIGDGDQEIPVGATLRTIIGEHGGSTNDVANTGGHRGGGGGGTGVLFLPPGIDPYYESKAEDWVILSVAGGGGGGYAIWGGKIGDGLPGNSGESGTGQLPDNEESPDDGGCPVDGIRWGARGDGGGGGTGHRPINSIPLCTDMESDALYGDGGSGYTGFQSSYGKIQPTGRSGPAGQQKGGFGFGSGGAGSANTMGGGGGYSGGFGGNPNPLGKTVKAGGGGSYVNSAYAAQGSCVKVKNTTAPDAEHGHVIYRILDSFELPFLARGQQYTNARSKKLLTHDDYTLRWQKDGNLVLYKGEFSAANAQWTSGTESRGKKLVFQNDGNLVILDANNQAIWATATADAQHDGKGGVKLVLSPFGKLIIHNVDLASIWSIN